MYFFCLTIYYLAAKKNNKPCYKKKERKYLIDELLNSSKNEGNMWNLNGANELLRKFLPILVMMARSTT